MEDSALHFISCFGVSTSRSNSNFVLPQKNGKGLLVSSLSAFLSVFEFSEEKKTIQLRDRWLSHESVVVAAKAVPTEWGPYFVSACESGEVKIWSSLLDPSLPEITEDSISLSKIPSLLMTKVAGRVRDLCFMEKEKAIFILSENEEGVIIGKINLSFGIDKQWKLNSQHHWKLPFHATHFLPTQIENRLVFLGKDSKEEFLTIQSLDFSCEDEVKVIHQKRFDGVYWSCCESDGSTIAVCFSTRGKPELHLLDQNLESIFSTLLDSHSAPRSLLFSHKLLSSSVLSGEKRVSLLVPLSGRLVLYDTVAPPQTFSGAIPSGAISMRWADPDERNLWCQSWDTVELVDILDGVVATLQSIGTVGCGVGFEDNGRNLFCGDMNGNVWAWPIHSPQDTLKGEDSSLSRAAKFRYHLSASAPIHQKEQRVRDALLLSQPEEIELISPQGRALANSSQGASGSVRSLVTVPGPDNGVIVGHMGGILGWWSGKEGEKHKKIFETSGDITCLQWCPSLDGFKREKERKKGEKFLAMGDTSGHLTLFSVCDFEFRVLWSILAHEPQPERKDSRFGSLGKKAEIWSLCWSPCGSFLSTTSEDQTTRIWDSQGGLVQELQGHRLAVTSVDWKKTQLGDILATCSDDLSVMIWRNEKGEEEKEEESKKTVAFRLWKTFRTNEINPLWHTLTYLSLLVPSNIVAVTTQNGWLIAWDLETNKTTFAQKLHMGSVEGLSWSSVSRFLATVSSDCSCCLLALL